MTLSKQTLTRLPRIKKGLINGLTIGQIADICRVTEKTVDRDLNKFRASPLFEEWLREEWQRLHYIIISENPVEAYRQLTRLLGQTFIRKIEAKTESKIEVIAPWLNKFVSPATSTNHIRDNKNSMNTPQDSESSPAEEDGEKTTAQSTKQ